MDLEAVIAKALVSVVDDHWPNEPVYQAQRVVAALRDAVPEGSLLDVHSGEIARFVETDGTEATPVGEMYASCLSADMSGPDRSHHILCHKPKGHIGRHGNSEYQWGEPLFRKVTSEP